MGWINSLGPRTLGCILCRSKMPYLLPLPSYWENLPLTTHATVLWRKPSWEILHLPFIWLSLHPSTERSETPPQPLTPPGWSPMEGFSASDQQLGFLDQPPGNTFPHLSLLLLSLDSCPLSPPPLQLGTCLTSSPVLCFSPLHYLKVLCIFPWAQVQLKCVGGTKQDGTRISLAFLSS